MVRSKSNNINRISQSGLAIISVFDNKQHLWGLILQRQFVDKYPNPLHLIIPLRRGRLDKWQQHRDLSSLIACLSRTNTRPIGPFKKMSRNLTIPKWIYWIINGDFHLLGKLRREDHWKELQVHLPVLEDPWAPKDANPKYWIGYYEASTFRWQWKAPPDLNNIHATGSGNINRIKRGRNVWNGCLSPLIPFLQLAVKLQLLFNSRL